MCSPVSKVAPSLEPLDDCPVRVVYRLIWHSLSRPLYLYQLPVCWTRTECCTQPLCYWKAFTIWLSVSSKTLNNQAANKVEAERPCPISWKPPLCRDFPCCCVLVLQSWRSEEFQPLTGFLSMLAYSCYQLWNLKGLHHPLHSSFDFLFFFFAGEEAEYGLILNAIRAEV